MAESEVAVNSADSVHKGNIMARKAQLGSAQFTLAPVAPLEVVQKGMGAVWTDLVARLTQKRSENSKLAAVKQKLVRAQLDVMEKAGLDVKALASEAKRATQQLKGESKAPPIPPGLQVQIPRDLGGVPGLGLVTPPYNYDWTATGYIVYGTGTLSAYATRQTGVLGFDEEPAAILQTEAFSTYAAAAVGFSFRPQRSGLLTVGTAANISDSWAYDSQWTGSNTRGWIGFLVQAYDASNVLVETPIYQQIILFDEGSTGGIVPESGHSSDSLNPVVVTPEFVVTSQLWYAIWFWCGGDIHTEGYNEFSGAGSWASAKLAVSVPWVLLRLQ